MNADDDDDAEVERILSLSEEEIKAEMLRKGLDPEIEVLRMKAAFAAALAQAKKQLFP